MGSGVRWRAIGQLEPVLGISTGLLDATEAARDVVRQRRRVLADLEPPDRAHGGAVRAGKDNAGIQDAERVEGALGLGEQRHDLVAVDAGEQSGAEPAVAVLTAYRRAGRACR